MAIVQTVNFSSFCDMFTRMGRQDQFSYEAKHTLFEYLDNLSDDTGEDYELDIIELCCEYSEDSAEDINEYYSIGIEREEDESEEDFAARLNSEVEEYLEENTKIVHNDNNGTFVYAQF